MPETTNWREMMATFTIEILTDQEKKRAFEILNLVNKIKMRRWNAFCASLVMSLFLVAVFFCLDIFLLTHNFSLFKATGLPFNSSSPASASIILSVLLFIVIFACVITIPLYFAVFKPRARLRALKLEKLVYGENFDSFFSKIDKIRALSDILTTQEIDELSDPALKMVTMEVFLTRSLIHTQINT